MNRSGISTRFRLHFLVLAGVASVSVFVSCGAPTKKASDVTAIFEKDESLGGKAFSLCSSLSGRKASPTLSGVALSSEDCKGAGRDAQHLNNLVSGKDKELKFAGFERGSLPDATSSDGKDTLVEIKARSQLWVNRTLVGVVSMLSSSLQGMSASETKAGSEISIFGGDASLDQENSSLKKDVTSMVTPKVIIKDPPVFNQQTGEFHLALTITATGQITLNNDFNIDGGIYDGAIAVAVETPNEVPFEQSLLSSVKILVLIIPYDSDIYIDLNVNMKMHSIGVDSIFQDQIKTMLDSFAKVVVAKIKSLDK